MKKAIYLSFVLSACLLTGGIKAQQPLDPTFGNNGIAVIDSVDAFYGADIALQGDNKILALFHGNCGHGFLCRLMPDGSLDPSFTPDFNFRSWPVYHPGVIEMQGHACNPNQSAVRGLSTGKVLLVISPWGMFQFNNDGTTDSSFGNNGVTSLISYPNPNPLAPGTIMDLQEVPGTGVLFAGSAAQPFIQDSLAICRMLYSGSMDNSFGNGGYIKVALPVTQVGNSSEVKAIRILPNNRILVAGSSIFTGNPNMRDVFLAMYNFNGSLITSFGTNGVKLIHQNSDYDDAWDLEYRDDNNIYLFGSTFTMPNGGTRYVCKFNASGVINTGFGTNGFSSWPVISFNGNTAFHGAVSPNNFVYTAADTGTAMNYNYLSYNSAGAANSQFMPNGIYSTANPDKVYKMISQPDNKILLLGTNSLHPRLMRFQASINTGLPEVEGNKDGIALWADGKKVYFSLADAGMQDVQLTLFSIDGRKISSYSEKDCRATGKNSYNLSLPTNLPAGTYLMQLVTNEKKSTIKIML